MRAIAIERFGGPEELREADVAEPLLAPDGILIRVAAAGVNPVDTKIRAGRHTERFPHFFPLVPGWDAAGVVEQVGPAVVDFQLGDEVFSYCRKDYVRDGAYAERVAVRGHQLARKPRTVGFAAAAATPLAALTAYQALHEALALERGERVLIHAAAGGVGSFAVQLAREAGAHVIATASAANHDYLRSLGAADLVDYREQDFVAAIEGVDCVLDLIGGDTLTRSAEVLRAGGRVASVLEPPSAEAFPSASSRRYVFVRPDPVGLARIAALIDAGSVSVHVGELLPLAEARRAHEQLEQGHTRGKVALAVDEEMVG